MFVALDTDLNREVALKEILERHAGDAVSRQRFELEAEITGKLEHPGVVPVYGFGRHSDGRPYYAMRFIKGDTLKEAITAFHSRKASEWGVGERSLELRKLLSRFVDVCETMGYAHDRGVVHRDLKPSNIIVGQYGETLVVDWGLAKPIGRSEPSERMGERTLVPSSGSGSHETLPGSALGTPSYMSPEQGAGDLDRVGPRSDVYSLGATLYCLLTGRPPFEGENLGEILRDVQAGKFTAPRTVDDSIDPALEAICLKAMSTRLEDRYGSSRALGADIERWAADEPVSCHAEPALKRVARWQRRHPTLSHGGLAALLVTAVGMTVTAKVINDQKQETLKAKAAAEQSALKARSSFDIATNAVFRILSQVSDQQLIKVPGLEKVRLEMLDEAIRHFATFRLAEPENVIVAQLGRRVYSDAAVCRLNMGNFLGAVSAYRTALEIADTPIGPDNLPPVDRALACQIRLDLLRCYLDQGFDTEASQELETIVGMLGPMMEGVDPRVTPKKGDLAAFRVLQVAAITRFRQAQIDRNEGDDATAIEAYRDAIERFKVVSQETTAWFWYRLFRGQAHQGLGQLLHRAGDEAEADRHFAEATAIIRAVVADYPLDNDPRNVLAYCLKNDAERRADNPALRPEALRLLDEAADLEARLHTDFPGLTSKAQDRADILLARGILHATEGRNEAAADDLLEASAELTRLLGINPTNRVIAASLGRTETQLGALRVRQGQRDEGRKLIETGIARLEAVRSARPKNRDVRRCLDEARKLQGL